MPENPPNPPWAYVGANIVHSKFGPGTITHVGPYKGVAAVSVQFDGHEKALEIEYALPHVRLADPKPTSGVRRFLRRKP